MSHRHQPPEARFLPWIGALSILTPFVFVVGLLGYRELNSLPQLDHAQAALSMIELKLPNVERLPYCALYHTGLDKVHRRLCDYNESINDWGDSLLAMDTAADSGWSD